VKYAIYEPCNAEPCPNQTTVGQYDIFRYPTMKKWQDEARPDFNNLDGGRDVLLMRLGETYLLAAEAALGAGDQAGARAYIVTLRQRAANCGGCAAEAANRVLIVDATHLPATIDPEYILDEHGRPAPCVRPSRAPSWWGRRSTRSSFPGVIRSGPPSSRRSSTRSRQRMR